MEILIINLDPKIIIIVGKSRPLSVELGPRRGFIRSKAKIEEVGLNSGIRVILR